MKGATYYGGTAVLIGALALAMSVAQTPTDPLPPSDPALEPGLGERAERMIAFDGLTGANPCDQETLVFSGDLMVRAEHMAEESSQVSLHADATNLIATGEESGARYTSADTATADIELGEELPAESQTEFAFEFQGGEGREPFTAYVNLQVSRTAEDRIDTSLGDVRLECR